MVARQGSVKSDLVVKTHEDRLLPLNLKNFNKVIELSILNMS